MAQKHVVRVGTMSAQESRGDELVAFAKRVILPLLGASDGFLGGELLHNEDDPNTIMIIERWESAAAHAASAKNIPPEAIQEVMTLMGGPPAGAYYTSCQTIEV